MITCWQKSVSKRNFGVNLSINTTSYLQNILPTKAASTTQLRLNCGVVKTNIYLSRGVWINNMGVYFKSDVKLFQMVISLVMFRKRTLVVELVEPKTSAEAIASTGKQKMAFCYAAKVAIHRRQRDTKAGVTWLKARLIAQEYSQLYTEAIMIMF